MIQAGFHLALNQLYILELTVQDFIVVRRQHDILAYHIRYLSEWGV